MGENSNERQDGVKWTFESCRKPTAKLNFDL